MMNLFARLAVCWRVRERAVIKVGFGSIQNVKCLRLGVSWH